MLLVGPQVNQQPDPLLSTQHSRVGHSLIASCAMEPSAACTRSPLKCTVRITQLTYSPTESGTEALMSIQSWAPFQEAVHPPPRPPQQGPGTPRNCSLTPPSLPRAARGARAAPRATAPRFPQRRRMVRH